MDAISGLLFPHPPQYMQEISLLLSRHLYPLTQFPERYSFIF